MKKLLILVICLTGCASAKKAAPEYNTVSRKLDHCIMRYIRMNLTGQSSIDICSFVNKRRD